MMNGKDGHREAGRPGFDAVGVTTPFYCNDGRGNFLLHRRSENCRDERGAWDPGAGALELGLSVRENVLKEVMEEYGCRGVIQEQVPAHDIFREQEGRRTHWVAVPFFVLVDPREARMNEQEKMDEMAWFRLGGLPSPLHSGFAHSLAAFRPYFEKYQG